MQNLEVIAETSSSSDSSEPDSDVMVIDNPPPPISEKMRGKRKAVDPPEAPTNPPNPPSNPPSVSSTTTKVDLPAKKKSKRRKLESEPLLTPHIETLTDSNSDPDVPSLVDRSPTNPFPPPKYKSKPTKKKSNLKPVLNVESSGNDSLYSPSSFLSTIPDEPPLNTVDTDRELAMQLTWEEIEDEEEEANAQPVASSSRTIATPIPIPGASIPRTPRTFAAKSIISPPRTLAPETRGNSTVRHRSFIATSILQFESDQNLRLAPPPGGYPVRRPGGPLSYLAMVADESILKMERFVEVDNNLEWCLVQIAGELNPNEADARRLNTFLEELRLHLKLSDGNPIETCKAHALTKSNRGKEVLSLGVVGPHRTIETLTRVGAWGWKTHKVPNLIWTVFFEPTNRFNTPYLTRIYSMSAHVEYDDVVRGAQAHIVQSNPEYNIISLTRERTLETNDGRSFTLVTLIEPRTSDNGVSSAPLTLDLRRFDTLDDQGQVNGIGFGGYDDLCIDCISWGHKHRDCLWQMNLTFSSRPSWQRNNMANRPVINQGTSSGPTRGAPGGRGGPNQGPTRGRGGRGRGQGQPGASGSNAE
jgi:hypothetical protein